MKITKRQLKKIIREELIREQDMSNSDLAGWMKSKATDVSAAVPTKHNGNFQRGIEMLAAMSKYDATAFNKVLGLMDSNAAKALEKAQKGEEPEAAEGEEAEGQKPVV